VRLWSIHPQYLDRIGLIALWRESLLAQKVLRGETKGYRNHPQLKRFKQHPRPQQAIAHYLVGVCEEGYSRGYQFNNAKISAIEATEIEKILVTTGQLRHELDWLRVKMKRRDLTRYQQLLSLQEIKCHPSFAVVEGEIEKWEKNNYFW
jgi:hypothetical protein